jgi:hypothetical protein
MRALIVSIPRQHTRSGNGHADRGDAPMRVSGAPPLPGLTDDVLTTVPREGNIVTLKKVQQADSYRASGMWRLVNG